MEDLARGVAQATLNAIGSARYLDELEATRQLLVDEAPDPDELSEALERLDDAKVELDSWSRALASTVIGGTWRPRRDLAISLGRAERIEGATFARLDECADYYRAAVYAGQQPARRQLLNRLRAAFMAHAEAAERWVAALRDMADHALEQLGR